MKEYKILTFAMGLQLFATHVNVTTDTQATTGNELSPEMKTYYDMELIDEAQANLVHDQFGQKKPIPKGSGKTIEFRKFAPLAKALTPLTEGVTPDGDVLNVSTITATVSQYGNYIVQSDVLELTAIDNTILQATKLLGRQAGLTLDTVTRNVLQASTNVSYASTWSGDTETEVSARADMDETSVLKVDTVNQVVAKLKSINAPTINGDYVAIIHPYNTYELKRDPEWIESHKYAQPDNLYTGEIGKIGGVRFVESSEALIIKDATCPTYTDSDSQSKPLAVFSTLFLAEGGYGVTEVTGGGLQTIIKQKGSAGTADPLDQRSSVGWKAIKTAELLIPDYVVRVESVSPRFSKTASAN